MANITLRDEDGRTLAEAPLGGSGLGKYVKSAMTLRSVRLLAAMRDQPLADLAGEARQVDFALERDVSVGRSSELTLQAGGSAAVGVHGAGSALFRDRADAPDRALQADVIVPNGTTYASLRLEARLKAGLSTGPEPGGPVPSGGQLSFGFEAGTGVGYAYFHPFDTAASVPTFAAALKETIGRAALAADADDLTAIPVGAFVSLTGSGRLALSGSASLGATTNVLATPGLPLIGKVTVPASASLSVNAAWEASGEFELRVGRPASGQITLSYHKLKGRAFSIGAKAAAGIELNVRDSDLIARMIRAVSSNPEADLLALVNAGLSDEQIERIQQAIAASIDRSLTVSAQMQLSSVREDEALFGYELSLETLSADAREAVGKALHGDLTGLDALADVDGSGVRVSRIATGRLRARKTSWRINLFGILNSASLKEQIRTGVMTFDPINGALNIADKIAGMRIRVDARPLESDPRKLRRLLFESLVVTAAYRASQAVPAAVTLSAEHTYLEQHGRTTRATVEDHYRAILALGLCDRAERDARLGTEQEFGASTFSLHARFDATACDALFLDPTGQPWPEARYERIARHAFLALIPADDPARSFRRFVLDSDTIWPQAVLHLADIDTVLPAHIRGNALRVEIVRGDVFTIRWWAKTMSKAGPALLEVRKFIAGRDAATLANDAGFKSRREALEQALAAVVANTQARFEDPWDVLALDFAASGADAASAVIVSTKLAASYDEETVAEAVVPAMRAARSAARARAVGAATADEEAGPAFTPEQLAILERHVVNLHNGVLSTGGAFTSTEDQVRKIFTEHIPQAIAARRPSDGPARVVFYAHGGLIEELEGLKPVLARVRFWLLNNIYPVFFVWETGLRTSIEGVLLGTQRRGVARAAATDALLEELTRELGRRIWAEMKTNARSSVTVRGGGTLAAKCARDLWNAHPDGVEFHAVGHSAGSIFHAHFLPSLLNQPTAAGVPKLSVRSLHFLAPAITTKLFTDTLKPLIGAGKPITALTMYTMNDALEQADPSMRPYGKSLLYLVSKAFEDAQPTPILGLEHSLKREVPLIRFFGLAGREKVADVCFSQTASTVPLNSRSQSTTHGGFDNDVATMSSVARRIVQAPETQVVTEFFEDPVEGFDRGAVPPARVAAAAVGASRRRAGAIAGPTKKWTVLVWMAGDNHLDTFGDADLAEMKRIGSDADVDVVVQFDSIRDDGTRRYHIGRGTTLDQDLVEALGETRSGDPAVVADFFMWGIKRYPADRVLAVIWKRASSNLHRRALFSTTLERAVNDRALAFDDASRDFLDSIELQKVLADVTRATGRPIDLLGFDAGLLNTIEVAYQLRSTTTLVVGAEEIEPAKGWPYDRVLASLTGAAAPSPRTLGESIVSEFVDDPTQDRGTQSLLDLERAEAAAEAVDDLAAALIAAIKKAADFVAVTKAFNATQRFDTPDFVDLGHFCRELARRTTTSRLKTAAKAVIARLDSGEAADRRAGEDAENGLIAFERHKGSTAAGTRGLAIYFPRGVVSPIYGKLDFAKQTRWGRFLDAYHKG